MNCCKNRILYTCRRTMSVEHYFIFWVMLLCKRYHDGIVHNINENTNASLFIVSIYIDMLTMHHTSLHIYKLTCSSGLCKWTTMSQKLQMGRNSFVVFPLTDSSVSCTPRQPNLPPPKKIIKVNTTFIIFRFKIDIDLFMPNIGNNW